MAEGAPRPEALPATGGHGGTHPDESQDTGRVPSRGDVARRGSGARCLSPGSSSGTSAASCCLSRPARPPGRGCLSPRPGPLDPAPRRVPLRPGETTGPKTAQGHNGARADARGNVQAERRVCPGPAPTRGLGTPLTDTARSRDPLSQTRWAQVSAPRNPRQHAVLLRFHSTQKDRRRRSWEFPLKVRVGLWVQASSSAVRILFGSLLRAHR